MAINQSFQLQPLAYQLPHQSTPSLLPALQLPEASTHLGLHLRPAALLPLLAAHRRMPRLSSAVVAQPAVTTFLEPRVAASTVRFHAGHLVLPGNRQLRRPSHQLGQTLRLLAPLRSHLLLLSWWLLRPRMEILLQEPVMTPGPHHRNVARRPRWPRAVSIGGETSTTMASPTTRLQHHQPLLLLCSRSHKPPLSLYQPITTSPASRENSLMTHLLF